MLCPKIGNRPPNSRRQVTEAAWAGEFGNRVNVGQGARSATGYSHMPLMAPGLRAGDCAEAGSVIGLIGATGLIASPHLHFEVRRHGVWHDPERFLH